MTHVAVICPACGMTHLNGTRCPWCGWLDHRCHPLPDEDRRALQAIHVGVAVGVGLVIFVVLPLIEWVLP